MATPEEEFDGYASHGEDFNAEDQVAALLTENQNLPELTSRVSECRSTYLSELQVLLMGYHADFLQIGQEMKEVCDVVDELKMATRKGRTAIGDVSAWSLPFDSSSASGGQEGGIGSAAFFALGDPWAEEDEAGEQFNHHHAASSSSNNSNSHDSSASSLLNNNNKINQIVLPITYLATLSRSDENRSATLDQAGQAHALISKAQKTERLLHCSLERVQRRMISSREIFGLKEIDEIAKGANEHLGHRVRPAPSSLSMLRSGILDSFENESWSRHPLGIGDLEPRWNILADVGRTLAASSLLLRTHSALINDFSTSLVQSSIDIRMSILRFSTVLSAIIEHAANQRSDVILMNQNGSNNGDRSESFSGSSAADREDDDPAALTNWAMREINRAATDVFAPFIERRKHIAPNAEAAGSSKSFQSATVVAAADSIAMDIALANNFMKLSSASSISSSSLFLGPLSYSLLRKTQPNQLNFFWSQVLSAIAADFNFGPQEQSIFLDSNQLLLGEICGAEQLPRQSIVRCISPFLSGVRQHQGLANVFDSDDWLSICDKSKIPAITLKTCCDLLLGSYVSESARRLWDHFTNVLLVKDVVMAQLNELNEQTEAVSANENQLDDLIEFYFSHPDWQAQVDLALTHILSSFVTSLVGEYRDSVNSSARSLVLKKLEQTISEQEKNKVDFVTPPVLSCFRPSLFVSAIDISIASSLSVVTAASKVAGLLLESNINNNNSNNNNNISPNSSSSPLVVVNSKCSLVCQRKILNFILDSVYHRTASTYSLTSSISVNELRLRADGGGALGEFSSSSSSGGINGNNCRMSSIMNNLTQKMIASENNDNNNTSETSERAALFLLLPYANSTKGSGELSLLEWGSKHNSSSSSQKALSSEEFKSFSDLLLCLTCNKIIQQLAFCQKVGGSVAASLYAVGLAFFMSDVCTVLSPQCWNILTNVRAPFLKSVMMTNSSQGQKQPQQQLSSQGATSLLRTISAVLYILSPALEPAKEAVFANFEEIAKQRNDEASSVASNPIYDVCIERVRNVVSSSSEEGASSSSLFASNQTFSFESILSSTVRDLASSSADTKTFSCDVPECSFGSNLSTMKDAVEELCCNIGNDQKASKNAGAGGRGSAASMLMSRR